MVNVTSPKRLTIYELERGYLWIECKYKYYHPNWITKEAKVAYSKLAAEFDNGVKYAEWFLHKKGEEIFLAHEPKGSRAFQKGFFAFKTDYLNQKCPSERL